MAALAVALNAWAVISNAPLISPRPRTFSLSFFAIKPLAYSTSGLMAFRLLASQPRLWMASRLMPLYSTRVGLVKPNLGRRRASGGLATFETTLVVVAGLRPSGPCGLWWRYLHDRCLGRDRCASPSSWPLLRASICSGPWSVLFYRVQASFTLTRWCTFSTMPRTLRRAVHDDGLADAAQAQAPSGYPSDAWGT
jgi:hypothetical protein